MPKTLSGLKCTLQIKRGKGSGEGKWRGKWHNFRDKEGEREGETERKRERKKERNRDRERAALEQNRVYLGEKYDASCACKLVI